MENLLLLLPKRPQSTWTRLGITILVVLVFFMIRIGFEDRLGRDGFFIMFPAIFLPSLLFDRGSGFLATAFSVGLLYGLVEPRVDLEGVGERAVALTLFAVIGGGVAVFTEALRNALEHAVAAQKGKDLLLQEMGHRIKNNLQTVASLLHMQARSQQDAAVRASLDTAASRVHVIAGAHDYLRPEAHDNVVDMQDYLSELVTRLGDMLRGDRPVAVRVAVETGTMRAERAALIGLIVNELVTNSFKYAFEQSEAGHIDVEFRRTADGAHELVVSDDGRGQPQGKEGFGMRLVRLMAGQLGGTIAWEDGRPGRRVVVTIPGE